MYNLSNAKSFIKRYLTNQPPMIKEPLAAVHRKKNTYYNKRLVVFAKVLEVVELVVQV